MAKIDDLIDKLPLETRDIFRTIWETLSPDDRLSLLSLLQSLPSDASLIRLLIRLSTNQFRIAFGQKQSVAIVGPANVGKSTLYNQIVQTKEDQAQVSALPGTTRVNQQADAGLFSIVDTPGADAVGQVGEAEQREALDATAEADFLIIMFDAIQGVKKTELDLYSHLVGLKKPNLVVLNKIDLVRKESAQVVSRAAKSLGLEDEQVIPIVARNGEGLSHILAAIAMIEPEIVTALGRGLPQFRWQLAWRSIAGAASASAVIALTPLPVIDFAPLVIIQSVMVLGIARIYNYRIDLGRARELVVTFGLGFLARTLFAELSKLGGLPGWVLSAAIASSTTVVMGYAAAIWFERGEKLSAEALNRLTKSLTGVFVDVLKGIGKRRPDRASLRKRIDEALQQSSLGEDRSLLDEEVKDQSSKTGP